MKLKKIEPQIQLFYLFLQIIYKKINKYFIRDYFKMISQN